MGDLDALNLNSADEHAAVMHRIVNINWPAAFSNTVIKLTLTDELNALFFDAAKTVFLCHQVIVGRSPGGYGDMVI